MTKKQQDRLERLMPGGIPRWVRIYDAPDTIDRYTIVFSGGYNNIGQTRRGIRRGSHPYLGMSGSPFHPQGIAQHGESFRCIDVNSSGFAPSLGRKCHLGRRIRFRDLPEDCQKVVLRDYKELWQLE